MTRRKDDIRNYLKEIDCSGMVWIELAKSRDKRRCLMVNELGEVFAECLNTGNKEPLRRRLCSKKKKIFRGLSPRANYTDRAACRRS
jgi:hypothetical protein